MLSLIIIIILWGIFALLAIEAFAPFPSSLTKFEKWFIVILIFITAPFLAISNVINNILNIFVPGEDDDDAKKH